MNEAFFTLHSDLPREGPGEAADVIWALGLTGPVSRVLDAACGPGADTLTLAQELPAAYIDAVDKIGHFVDSARERTSEFGDRTAMHEGDMFDVTGPYDLIWCAGAVYFSGITSALSRWRPALAEGGFVAFSEAVAPSAEAPQAARDFWADYPGLQSAADISAEITRAGYRIVGQRRIVGPPWQAYYGPLQSRINDLRATAEPALSQVLDENQKEIDLWKAAPDHVAYLLNVVQPA